MSAIETILAERGSRYGTLMQHGTVVQDLKAVLHTSPKWAVLEPDQKEALDMIAHKIGRIVCGDPTYIDTWTDIVGYARLVEKRLQEQSWIEEKSA